MHASVLRYLREVARCGSVRKAATALRVASSAVNRQILKLEDELGVRLFDRLPEGMRLTPAGEVLLRHVRDTLHDYDRLVAEIDGLRGIRTGHVRIAALDSLLLDLLPGALERFVAAYPAVTFSVVSASPSDVFRQVQAAEADLGLTFVAPAGPALQSVVSVPAPIGAIMTASHPLAGRKRLGFEELLLFPALIQRDNLPAPSFVDDDYAAFRAAVQVRFASNEIAFIKRLLRSGLGVGFYTRFAFLAELAAGEMVWVPLASPRLAEQHIGLFVPTQRSLSPAGNALVGELAKWLEAL
ncbi:LysR family transcriptional regulator [Roseomonas sp. BN140053]|uniref:LysR family transcriptional regulator n=1 Tax=Roseomonas sp. BN140053 TaxID=3391898 RepID=UPI0039ED39B1